MPEALGPKNALVQQARLLARDRHERTEQGLAVLEGIRLAEEALAAGVTLQYVLYSAHLAERERGAALLQALRQAGAPLHLCSAEALERAADTQSPQGIVAVFRPRVWTLQELRPGLVVVLDNLQDPGNIGTVIRTSEALGGGGAVVCGGVDPTGPKVVRGAMGSLFRLPVVRAEIGEVLPMLKHGGRRIYVADAGGDLTPWQADLRAPAAVVIGNEGAGPSDAARSFADGIIQIPMVGATESLNAGVAASLLIYEARRQRT